MDVFTEKQKDILTGIMLGDASIGNEKIKNLRLSFSQCEAHKEYFHHIRNELMPFSGKVSIYKNLKFRNPIFEYKFKTITHPVFTQLRKKWYKYDPRKKTYFKIVPKDINLNWRAIAYWHADDGCNWQPKKFVLFSSQSFNKEDNEFLAFKLKEMGIKTTLNKRGEHKWVIRVSTKNYFDFQSNIRPYLEDIDCMKYKIDVSLAKTKPSIDVMQYNESVKLKAVKLWKKGKKPAIICNKIGCHRKTLHRWVKKHGMN